MLTGPHWKNGTPAQRRRLVDVMIVITDTKMRTMNTNVKFIIYALMIIFIVKILNQRRITVNKLSTEELQDILKNHKMWIAGDEKGRRADLCGADLREADLRGADLRKANLRNCNYNYLTVGLNLSCPETGSFIGYKKADNKIIVLEICEDSKRSSATSRKCRCSKAKVLKIEDFNGNVLDISSVPSDYDKSFVYQVGEIVEVKDFDENRWNECSTGIHFFITKKEAVEY